MFWFFADSADEIERGCRPIDLEVELKHECTDELCNVATIPICKQCSENLDDCKTVFCKINDDDDDDDGGDNDDDDDDDGLCYISKGGNFHLRLEMYILNGK